MTEDKAKEGEIVDGVDTKAIAEFKQSEAALAVLREKFAVLPDFKTKEGYEEGRVGIRELVTLRTSLDKARKKLNKDDQDRISFRNAEAKRITGVLTELEDPMKAAKAVIDDAVELAKEEKRQEEARRIEKITEAMNGITQCGNVDPTMESADIKAMEARAVEVNAGFDFEEFKDAADAERKRVLAHVAKILLDRVEFEDQQREQTRIAQEQAEQQKLLDDKAAELQKQQDEQQKKIDDQQAEIDKQKADAAAEEERKAQEARAEEERKEKEAENKRKEEEADKLAENESARQEAMRPEKDKLLDWAKKLRFIDGPDGITDPGLLAILSAAQISLDVVAKHVIKKVEDF